MQRRRELMAMQSELPSAYQKVEYLHANADQYIATSYIPTIEDEIDTKFSFDVISSSNKAAFSAGTGGKQLILLALNNLTYFRYFQAGSAVSFGALSTTSMHQLHITSDGTIYIDGDEVASSHAGGGLDGDAKTLWLFRRRNDTSPMRGKIGRFTISNNTIKKLDLIPCVRKSDSEAGMYDTVSKTFYTNAGSGSFIIPT